MYPKNSNRNIIYATDSAIPATQPHSKPPSSTQYIQRKISQTDKNIRKSAQVNNPYQYESSNRIINSRIISSKQPLTLDNQSSVYHSQKDKKVIGLTSSHHSKAKSSKGNVVVSGQKTLSNFDKKMRHMSEANIKTLLSPKSKYTVGRTGQGTGKKSQTPLRPGHLSTQNLHSQVYGFGKSPRTTRDGKIVIVSDKKMIRRSDYESVKNLNFENSRQIVNGAATTTGFSVNNTSRLNSQRVDYRTIGKEQNAKDKVIPE
jgi:hypothetical protein